MSGDSAFVVIPGDEISPFLGIGKGNGFLGLGKSNGSSSGSASEGSSTKTPGATLAGINTTLGTIGGLAALLPSLGVGSGARVNEINATNQGNALIYGIQSAEADKEASQNKILYIAGGALVFVMVVLFMATRH